MGQAAFQEGGVPVAGTQLKAEGFVDIAEADLAQVGYLGKADVEFLDTDLLPCEIVF